MFSFARTEAFWKRRQIESWKKAYSDEHRSNFEFHEHDFSMRLKIYDTRDQYVGDMVKFYRAGRWWRWGQVWDWVWTTRWRRSRRREPWLAACRPRARRPNGAVRFPGNGSRRFSSSDPKAPPVPTRSQSEAAKVQRKMTFTFQARDNSRTVCPWLRASGKPGVTQLKFTDLIWSAFHLKITRLDDSCNRCAYKMWNVIKWPKQ